MKYLRRYKIFEDVDLTFAIIKIKEHYSKEEIEKWYDKEVSVWVDDTESYKKSNSGEAQEVIIESIIGWYSTTYKKELTEEEGNKLSDEIKKTYPILK